MKDFKTSLLREKFIIQSKDKNEAPLIALSNRISVHLISEDGIDDEVFIIRTQNMHSCARLAAIIVKEFNERGSILNRAVGLKWDSLWDDIIKGYDQEWNDDIWCAVYHHGRPIYHYGNYHPFLNIIEQCDSANKNEYSQSVKFAEDAFSKAGKTVSIEHDSNIALVVSSNIDQAKCGIIIRSASGTTTFNYTAIQDKFKPRPIQSHTTLTVAASYLEAVQLCFQVGFLEKKKEYGLVEEFSDEDRKYNGAKRRLGNLDRAITTYEQHYNINYRPERPDFKKIIQKSSDYSIKILKPQVEQKFADGDYDPKDWVV